MKDADKTEVRGGAMNDEVPTEILYTIRRYACSKCGAENQKLWRPCRTASPALLCVSCTCKAADVDPALVDVDGKRPARYCEKTDQIGWYVPAVPDDDGHLWSYCSVPPGWCEWWRTLPTGNMRRPGALRRTLSAFRATLAILRARKGMWVENRNEGTDVPIWYAEWRVWRIIDPAAEDAEARMDICDGDCRIHSEQFRESDHPVAGEWRIIAGAVFVTAEEADDWIASQRHNYPDGLRRRCAGCKRGSSLRPLLEAAR